MFFVMLLSLSLILNSKLLTSGQCTIDKCNNRFAESDESLENKFDEHDQKLDLAYNNLDTRLQEIQTADKVLVMDRKEQSQRLEDIFANISARLDGIDVKPNSAAGSLINEQMLINLQKNLSIEFTKTGEKIENVQNAVENLARQFDQKLNFVRQDFSLRLERVEGLLKELNDSREREHEDIQQKLQTVFHSLSTNHDEILQQVKSKDYCQEQSQVCDCSDIKARGFTTSEVYRIYVIDANKRHYANAYCDMTTANNSWIIFQRRKDGSEDFYRSWRNYSKGFGDPNGEYWLGNEFLHILTSKRRYRLRVDLEDFEGGKRYAEYLGFNIKSSEYNYTMTVGNYSGNAGDSLTTHSNAQFSTSDYNDISHCATVYHGAWWYTKCHSSNLNGRYLRGNHSSYADGINWRPWRGYHYSLKTTEMKIAPLN